MPTRILVCILTTYERTGWVSKELAEFIANIPMMPAAYASRVVFAHNFSPAASARNQFFKQVKEYKDIDWLCMIDNDMAPPLNLFDAVKDAPADAGVVVPMFHLWAADEQMTRMCWGIDVPPVNERGIVQIDPKFYELNKCGTGAIFVRPEVLHKVPAPWFWYTYNEDGGMESTEDINFAHKVREHGFKIYGNGAIEVGHHHSVNLLLVNRALQKGFQASECPSKPDAQAASPAS